MKGGGEKKDKFMTFLENLKDSEAKSCTVNILVWTCLNSLGTETNHDQSSSTGSFMKILTRIKLILVLLFTFHFFSNLKVGSYRFEVSHFGSRPTVPS